jgi:hypothetical protein
MPYGYPGRMDGKIFFKFSVAGGKLYDKHIT